MLNESVSEQHTLTLHYSYRDVGRWWILGKVVMSSVVADVTAFGGDDLVHFVGVKHPHDVRFCRVQLWQKNLVRFNSDVVQTQWPQLIIDNVRKISGKATPAVHWLRGKFTTVQQINKNNYIQYNTKAFLVCAPYNNKKSAQHSR